ncbi:MAG TPA: hypothetical protein PKC74_03570 [Turneriella sp.]|nr:hypothetical protein [Turneriella sp.]HMY10675.1 hypothetical protein [Turneriella sp.]
MHKQAIVSTIEQMPAEVEAEAVIEKILFLKNLEQGLADADEGKVMSEDELRQRFGKLLS